MLNLNDYLDLFTDEALEDYLELDGSVKQEVLKAIVKASKNPFPQSKGGYGKPLGNKNNINLAGLLKIKLKKSGIRIVYKIIYLDNKMKIIVIATRTDEEVYKIAEKRLENEN